MWQKKSPLYFLVTSARKGYLFLTRKDCFQALMNNWHTRTATLALRQLLSVQVDTHLVALSPPSFGGPWSSASCRCRAGLARSSPPLGQSPHPEASPRSHEHTQTEGNALALLPSGVQQALTAQKKKKCPKKPTRRWQLRSELKIPHRLKVLLVRVSCSKCSRCWPSEKRATITIDSPKYLQTPCSSPPKSHAVTAKIPEMLRPQY